MKILDELETIDQSAHELWADFQVRQAMRALPALIRVAREAEALRKRDWGANSYVEADRGLDLDAALQQLREVGNE